MAHHASYASQLNSSNSEIYRGRFDDFVRRRDARAKELRAAGDRAAADRMKSLRKPSRTAWALNLAAIGEPLTNIVAAVDATIIAQSSGGDVRTAIATQRVAVRAFAQHAADASSAEGTAVDVNALSTALLAVLANSESFDARQRGELGAVPEAGGLDFLSSFPVAPVLRVESGTSAPSESRGGSANDAKTSAARRKVAQEAIARARKSVDDCRGFADDALRALNRAETDLDAAERRLKEAHNAVAVATTKRDAARAKTEETTARMRKAEEQLEQAVHAADS